jgi:hypothetical protein
LILQGKPPIRAAQSVELGYPLARKSVLKGSDLWRYGCIWDWGGVNTYLNRLFTVQVAGRYDAKVKKTVATLPKSDDE